MDETPGLPAGAKGRAYAPTGTLDGAAVAGSEHNFPVTVVLTMSMLGVLAVPTIITPGNKKSVGLAESVADRDVIWTSTTKGWMDTPAFVSYAKRLRQQLGHDRPVLLLLDGHASHSHIDAVTMCHQLNIKLFFIPPHTSHGLAACDRFNQRLHARRRHHECQLSAMGVDKLSVSMRLQALTLALGDLSTMYSEIVAAWGRAGITPAERSVKLLANQPRRSAAAAGGGAGGLFSAQDEPFPVLPPVDPSLDPAAQLEAYRAREAAVSSWAVSLRARNQAEIYARLQHRAETLERSHQARVRTKRGIYGDVTRDDALAALALKVTRQQLAASKAGTQAAKFSREEPLHQALEQSGALASGARLTKVVLQKELANQGQPTSGSRGELVDRLAEALGIVLAAEEPEAPAGGGTAAAGAEDEADQMEPPDDNEDSDGENDADAADNAAITEEALLAARQDILDRCEVDPEAMAALLAEQPPSFKKYWALHSAAAETAWKKAQSCK